MKSDHQIIDEVNDIAAALSESSEPDTRLRKGTASMKPRILAHS